MRLGIAVFVYLLFLINAATVAIGQAVDTIASGHVIQALEAITTSLLFTLFGLYFVWRANHFFGSTALVLRKLQDGRFDGLTPRQFEEYVAGLLEGGGMRCRVTRFRGDFGIDVLGRYHGVRYAFQVKYWAAKVGIKAVQEACAGKEFYRCDYPGVVTNSTFSEQALRLARANGCIMIDGNELRTMVRDFREGRREFIEKHLAGGKSKKTRLGRRQS